ncbi:MAG: excinuclease ABC subunit UvrC [Desulfobacteraceae bacterium]|nr:excinuclease ABC subunit UvrC [Desulfobacteraceae bacterium]
MDLETHPPSGLRPTEAGDRAYIYHRDMNQTLTAQYELDPERLRGILPDRPGVYMFKDDSGRIIYVGKAKSLKKRVLSYFKPLPDLPHKTYLMMKKARGLDFLITSTEQEAFILESSLVKKSMPRYNIVLRDDKQYPCLRLDVREPYPRLKIARKIKKNRAVYFGPFSSANSVRSTLKVIERVFQLRKCKGRGLPKRTRPCLNYQMDRCLGPCTGDISESEYGEILHQVRLFLEGRNRELLGQLKRDMGEASENLDFEKAAKIRDQISAIGRTVERQHVVSQRLEDQDIIGLAQSGGIYQAVILFVRKGYLVGSRDYLLRNRGASAAEITEAFLKQYYPREAFIPKQVLISDPIEDLRAITEWLSDLAGRKVLIHRPLRGEKLRLVKMAVANAENQLAGHPEWEKEDLLGLVRAALGLESTPRFIEGLDISNLHGDKAVGSIVSFVDGLPHKAGYRNYRLKVVEGIDDYGMMAELVERRLAKGDLPDLFLVDGGKGHLSTVKRVLDRKAHLVTVRNGEGTYQHIPEVVSISKPDEEKQEKHDKMYVPGRKNPVRLRGDHAVLLFMMRIRDEAHRRAISYHRKLRQKALRESDLDHIPNIGSKRKRRLLEHFKGINAISDASPDDLERVPGISRTLAKNIFSYFRKTLRGEQK